MSSEPRREFDKDLEIVNSLAGRLGAGTFGVVYKGYYQTKDAEVPVAIKIFNSRTIDEHKELEGNLLKSLDHPNIVKVYQTGVHPRDGYYIAMELCDCTLKSFLQKHGIKKLPEKEAKSFFIEICKGVQYLQSKNIVHRDLKFENILINSSNHMKIADFGLAKMLDDSQVTNTTCGSTHIMAPEIFQGKSYGKFADNWSLGIILYGMITGDEVIYKNVNRKEYEEKLRYFQTVSFPPDSNLSPEVMQLVGLILNPEPDKRLSVEDILKHPWCKEEGESLTSTQRYLKVYNEKAQTKELTHASRIGNKVKKDLLSALESTIKKIFSNLQSWNQSYDAIRALDPSKLDLRELHVWNLIRIYKHLTQLENLEFAAPSLGLTKIPLQKVLDAPLLREFNVMKESVLQEIEELVNKQELRHKPVSDIEEKHLQAILGACDVIVSKGDISKAFDYRQLSQLYKACQAMMSSFSKDYDQMTVTVTPKLPALQRLAQDFKMSSPDFESHFQEILNSLVPSLDTTVDDSESLRSPYGDLYSVSFIVRAGRSSKQSIEKALKAVSARMDARLNDLK